MKILCLLALLANIVLLMWEYRTGAFTAHKESPGQHAFFGKEPIVLLRELKQEPHSFVPAPNQETQLEALKPGGNINDIQESTYNTENATATEAKQTEYRVVPLP